MANNEVQNYIKNVPYNNGKGISQKDYKRANDIIRAAFGSLLKPESFYADKNNPNKTFHVTKLASSHIQFLENKELQQMCTNVINKLEKCIKDFDKDRATLKNFNAFIQLSLIEDGNNLIYKNLAKEGKMINWEALTDKLLTKGFSFEQSDLYSEFADLAKEYNNKYQKTANKETNNKNNNEKSGKDDLQA